MAKSTNHKCVVYVTTPYPCSLLIHLIIFAFFWYSLGVLSVYTADMVCGLRRPEPYTSFGAFGRCEKRQHPGRSRDHNLVALM